RKVVQEQELATSVWAYTDESIDPGLLIIGAVLQQGKDPKDVEKAVDGEILRIKEGGVSGDELTRPHGRHLRTSYMVRNRHPAQLSPWGARPLSRMIRTMSISIRRGSRR
ncbi:MAG: insulinase family protein, partial [Candidatus Hydrothermia bacterium]